MSNSNNYYLNPNYYYPFLQNAGPFHYPYPSDAYANYPTNPEFQPNLPIVQQNYYNCPLPFIPQHQQNCNYNPENNFTSPKDINAPLKEDIGIGKYKKNRRERTTYSKSQTEILESYFEINPYPDITVRETISAQIQTSEIKVQVWFKNRRAKVKRTSQKIEMEKSTSNTEDSIIKSEISFHYNSDSEKEIHHHSMNGNEAPSERNMKREQKENNEPYYMNNNNNGDLSNYNDILRGMQQQHFYMNCLQQTHAGLI